MEWSRRVEYHTFLIYQKLTVQDFNFQLFGILRLSPLRFGGSPLMFITFYSNLSAVVCLAIQGHGLSLDRGLLNRLLSIQHG